MKVTFKVMAMTGFSPCYQQIRCHLIFDVKMEDFRRKARYVAQGNMTEASTTLIYLSVVSRESVRIAQTMAALNDLEVKTAETMNVYLTTPVIEKIWTMLGPELGQDCGKMAIVVRALYGLKSAGAAFRNHPVDCMSHLGYESCKADKDVWLKAETGPSDGHKYYSYILLYVDDVLYIHHNGVGTINVIDKYFRMKKGSIGDPYMYLGAKLQKIRLPNDVDACAISPSKYIIEVIKGVEPHLQTEYGGMKLAKRESSPFLVGYAPELDLSPELGPKAANYYM